jgi:hypothetical protein
MITIINYVPAKYIPIYGIRYTAYGYCQRHDLCRSRPSLTEQGAYVRVRMTLCYCCLLREMTLPAQKS